MLFLNPSESQPAVTVVTHQSVYPSKMRQFHTAKLVLSRDGGQPRSAVQAPKNLMLSLLMFYHTNTVRKTPYTVALSQIRNFVQLFPI